MSELVTTVSNRRAFLRDVGRVSASVACVSALPLVEGCAGVPYVPFERSGSTLRVPVSAFSESTGVLLAFSDEDRPIYVHQHDGGRYSAVLTRCSHRGCEVEPEGERLVCPCHGSEYTLEGDLLEGPADAPLLRYATRVEGEELLIETRSGGGPR